MEHRFEGERTRMRVYVGESDRAAAGPHRGRPLHHALLELLRERDFAGATVLRGIEGFGASARLHTANLLDLSLDLPIVVEVIETEERIRALLPELDEMIGGGLVTLERVRVILYRPAKAAEDERSRHRTEGLEPSGGADAPAG